MCLPCKQKRVLANLIALPFEIQNWKIGRKKRQKMVTWEWRDEEAKSDYLKKKNTVVGWKETSYEAKAYESISEAGI